MNIFVVKLNFVIDELYLWEVFEVYGDVDLVKIIFDKFIGKFKGYGFVEMFDDE